MTSEKTVGPPPSGGMATIRRLGRVLIFFATAGFVYPNVFAEKIDIAKLDAKHQIQSDKL